MVVRFNQRKDSGNILSKKKYLWSGVPETLINRLQMDDVSLYSVTDKKIADIQSNIIKFFSAVTFFVFCVRYQVKKHRMNVWL